MPSQFAISSTRFHTILDRQSISRWGIDYCPAILATRQEAPKLSRASRLMAAKIGREIHLLSVPERKAALLALYHPALFDLQEQKMLTPWPSTHPLTGHPLAVGLHLQALEGTVKVAERLGGLARHPRVTVEIADPPGTEVRVPFPYIGDLLLCMMDANGPFCVNWTVKKDEQGFCGVPGQRRDPTRQQRQREKADFRHALEEEYYRDASIRTVRVTETAIDDQLAGNLHSLFGWHARPINLSPDQRLEMIAHFQGLLGQDIAPLATFADLKQSFRCDLHDCLGVLYQGIWQRQLAVDLFRPVLPDRPLRPQQVDVLDVYQDWFRR